jgi:inorganic pyrophosphatase
MRRILRKIAANETFSLGDTSTLADPVAVPMPKLTMRYAHVMGIADMPKITIEQIQHFFEHYKDLEPGKWVKMIGWGDSSEARRLIVDAIARAKN